MCVMVIVMGRVLSTASQERKGMRKSKQPARQGGGIKQRVSRKKRKEAIAVN